MLRYVKNRKFMGPINYRYVKLRNFTFIDVFNSKIFRELLSKMIVILQLPLLPIWGKSHFNFHCAHPFRNAFKLFPTLFKRKG